MSDGESMTEGDTKRKPLGKILLAQRLVTPEQLEEVLRAQRRNPGQRLASTAARMGRIRELDLIKALSEQHGVPGIDLAQMVIPLAHLSLFPEEVARQHLILPIGVIDEQILLAMADPNDRRVIDEVEFVTGKRVRPYVALHDALATVIDEAYRRAAAGETYWIGSHVPADYLAQLGLEPSSGTTSPRAVSRPPPGVVSDRPVPSAELEDELGISELQRRRARTERAAEPERPMRARPKILVVDDEDDIRRLLRRVLAENGYDVVEASRGLEALEMVRSETPDLILLDAMLPEVHGFDICRRIKGSKRYGHIPILMISAVYRGWRFAEDLRASYGVEAFLEKPFKVADVLAWVDRALSGRSSEPLPSEDELSREAAECLQRGIEAYQRGELDRAIEHLQQGIGIDPLSYQLHFHLGLLHGRRDALFEAIHELETAVDLAPRAFPALKNLAVLYQRAGFRHKAVEMWERALAAAPDEETRRGIKDHLMSLL
ncbi:MAG: response regulator [Myxococcota bacterium]|nr:response regulator [Myxococcota bacterium]MDW8361472.1 response regulator [Myxococcales bacterium]